MDTFVGDTPRLTIRTGIDLSGYDVLWIKFRRPNGTQGHWVATIHANTTWMYYDLDPTDLNMPGTWVLEAHAHEPTPPGAVTARLHGKPLNLEVIQPLAETSTVPTTLAPTTTITTLAPTTLAP